MYEPIKTFTRIVPSTDTHFAVPFNRTVDPASMLLHLDGSGGSTTITDATGRHTLTANGNAQITNAWSRFGSGAATFDGINSNIQTNGGGLDFAYGNHDFTIDLWAKIGASTTGRIYAGGLLVGGGNCPIIDLSAGQVLWRFNSGIQITGGTVLVSGQVCHIAVTRAGTNTNLFINGTQDGATYVGSDILINDDANNCPRFGSNNSGGANFYTGQLDEIRVVNGLAVWTSNFTPPTSPYLP